MRLSLTRESADSGKNQKGISAFLNPKDLRLNNAAKTMMLYEYLAIELDYGIRALVIFSIEFCREANDERKALRLEMASYTKNRIDRVRAN